MSNLKYEKEDDNYNPINNLFYECKKLTKIKISGNLKKEEVKETGNNIFKNITEEGEIITSKK